MAALSSIKASSPLHIFSIKSPPSKLKTLFQTFISSHVYRIERAFAKAKSLLMEHVRGMHLLRLAAELKRGKTRCKRKLRNTSSFRLHYNWCASHVMPLAQETTSHPNSHHVYYDASWNVVVPTAATTKRAPDGTTSFPDYRESSELGLSRYLEWLEEKGSNNSSNEIDKLADMYIANCHEKFRLEKQESYRRFQEMMARSV